MLNANLVNIDILPKPGLCRSFGVQYVLFIRNIYWCTEYLFVLLKCSPTLYALPKIFAHFWQQLIFQKITTILINFAPRSSKPTLYHLSFPEFLQFFFLLCHHFPTNLEHLAAHRPSGGRLLATSSCFSCFSCFSGSSCSYSYSHFLCHH